MSLTIETKSQKLDNFVVVEDFIGQFRYFLIHKCKSFSTVAFIRVTRNVSFGNPIWLMDVGYDMFWKAPKYAVLQTQRATDL